VAVELGQHLSDDEIEKIFSKTDLDGDGYVTAEDFYSIMTHKPYWE
jgi:Ca2+-binding EF-hand superfamily protein